MRVLQPLLDGMEPMIYKLHGLFIIRIAENVFPFNDIFSSVFIIFNNGFIDPRFVFSQTMDRPLLVGISILAIIEELNPWELEERFE